MPNPTYKPFFAACGLFAALFVGQPANAQYNNPFGYYYNSPHIYAPNGQYLGNLNSNPYDPNSIANPIGRYGSPVSPDSVNNPLFHNPVLPGLPSLPSLPGFGPED
jgi:hypothetical protein